MVYSIDDLRDEPAGHRSLVGEPNPFQRHPRKHPYHAEHPLNRFRSERELADRVLERLAPWFAIEREVSGLHCSGKTLRIDAMIRPLDADSWLDPDVVFGVEFKLPPASSSIGKYTGWVAQAIDYTHVDWAGYGRRIVLTCPGAASWLDADPHANPEGKREVLIAKRLTGQLGIGELVLRWAHGLTVLVNGDNVWSERYGVSKGKSAGLRVKAGSR